MLITHKIIIGFALALSTISASADPIVYAITSNSQFGSLNLSTGAFSQIGPGMPEEALGLVQGSNGSLLTLTFSGKLDSINPATGVTTVVGLTGLADCTLPTSPCGPTSANALGELGGMIYATDFANRLYKVDPVTGAATLIGSTGIPAVPAIPGSLNPDGSLNLFEETLFGANGQLYSTYDAFTLNLTTFAATPLFPASCTSSILPREVRRSCPPRLWSDIC